MAAAADITSASELKGTPDVELIFHETTSTACFVVSDPATKECALIDTVMDFDLASGSTSSEHAEQVQAYVKEKGLTVKYILDTHVHADHLTGAALHKKAYPEAQTGIGARVAEVQGTFAKLFNLGDEFKTDGSQFCLLFNDGDTFKIGEIEARVMHTPGHTPACVTYVIGDACFTGDTVFMPDFGSARCDFPGGSAETLFSSAQKILGLAPGTRVFVGHDYKPGGRELKVESTVEQELKENKHLHRGTTQEQFVKFRSERDAQLGAPKLLLPSLQVNLRNGELPPAEGNGTAYLKIPLNALK